MALTFGGGGSKIKAMAQNQNLGHFSNPLLEAVHYYDIEQHLINKTQKKKKTADGNFDRIAARLVGGGHTQPDSTYGEIITFATRPSHRRATTKLAATFAFFARPRSQDCMARPRQTECPHVPSCMVIRHQRGLPTLQAELPRPSPLPDCRPTSVRCPTS
jgi:hypothetical protein